jgi:hypothetical protein
MTGPIAVAVPARDAARFVGQTLGSLAANGGGVRWWLQDGGSTDGTPEIARRLARPGDTVVSEPDAGQADALNRAFAAMGGEIVGFLNADDRWKPWTAEIVLRAFAENPGADLVVGAVEWIDADGNPTGHHAGRIGSYAEMVDVYRVWWGGRQWVQPEVFFRRTLWERVGGFDASMHLAFDFDFWVRCLRAGARVARVEEVLAEFRLHPDQKSAQARRAADEIRLVVARELAGGGPLPAWRRARIAAELGYDRYRLGEGPCAGMGFAAALARNPGWLLSAWARERLLGSLARKRRATGTGGAAR